MLRLTAACEAIRTPRAERPFDLKVGYMNACGLPRFDPETNVLRGRAAFAVTDDAKEALVSGLVWRPDHHLAFLRSHDRMRERR